MNGAWPTSLDQIWRSPAFPMWLALGAAAFFALLMLITLARAEKSVANGALTVIALLAVGIAVASTIRGGPAAMRGTSGETRAAPAEAAALPSLACLDDLAGDAVLGVCERAVFGSAESTAAAVSYVAAQISRLTSHGDAAIAARSMTPELQALRRSIEHDRYGIVAQVLQVRHHCTPTECTVFRALTDNHQIITNMDEHLYEGLVHRYATVWNVPPPASASAAPGMGALAAYPPPMPTGRPTTMDFPSSNSIPPVSIMSAEPARGASAPPTAAAPATRSIPPPAQSPAPPAAAAKKSAAKQPPRPAPGAQPAQISPAPSAPAASND